MVIFLLGLLLAPHFAPVASAAPPSTPDLVFAFQPTHDTVISQERKERQDYMLSMTNNTSKTCKSKVKFNRSSNVALDKVTFYPPQTFTVQNEDEKHGTVYSLDEIEIKPHKTVKYAFYLEANKSYPGDFDINYALSSDSITSSCGTTNWQEVKQKTTVTQFSQDFRINVDRNTDKLVTEGIISYKATAECIAQLRGSCNNVLNSKFSEDQPVTLGEIKATVDGQPYNKPVTMGDNEFSIPLVLSYEQKLEVDYTVKFE